MTPTCEASPPESAPGKFSTRAQIVAMTCVCACASAFLFAVNPNRHAVYPTCLLHQATGLYCAGCGATRALYALFHGRLLEAAHDNILLIAALPFLVGVAGIYLAEAWRGNRWPEREINPRTVAWRGAGIFLLMLLFMIARNLPGWPFDLLKPLAG